MTEINMTPKYRDVKPSGYYTYIHKRLSDGTPFYVGKGKGNRAWERTKSDCRSEHWINCANKNGVIVEICQDGLEEDAAYLLEAWLIQKLKNEGARLVNKSDGGIGPYGQKHSDETKKKISDSMYFPVWNDDGEKFKNSCEAARVMRARGYPKAASSGIFAACKDGSKTYTCYGHAWSREGVPAKYVNLKFDPVICLEEKLIFNSGGEAAKWLTEKLGRNIGSSWIYHAARNCSKSYGYTWLEIKDDY